MPRVIHKRRTPIVRTIKLNIGEHSSVFRLEKESLGRRRIAMEQVAKLHDLATAFIHGETAVFGERTHASYRDSLSDILGDALAVDWNYLELPVDDFFTFTAMSDSIYGSAPRPDEALSMAESGNPTQFREPPPPL